MLILTGSVKVKDVVSSLQDAALLILDILISVQDLQDHAL